MGVSSIHFNLSDLCEYACSSAAVLPQSRAIHFKLGSCLRLLSLFFSHITWQSVNCGHSIFHLLQGTKPSSGLSSYDKSKGANQVMRKKLGWMDGEHQTPAWGTAVCFLSLPDRPCWFLLTKTVIISEPLHHCLTPTLTTDPTCYFNKPQYIVCLNHTQLYISIRPFSLERFSLTPCSHSMWVPRVHKPFLSNGICFLLSPLNESLTCKLKTKSDYYYYSRLTCKVNLAPPLWEWVLLTYF